MSVKKYIPMALIYSIGLVIVSMGEQPFVAIIAFSIGWVFCAFWNHEFGPNAKSKSEPSNAE